MLKIKKMRFGQSLEEFKTSHEQPIVQLHAEIRAHKSREQKKAQNREASKSSALRKRAKKVKKAEIAAMDTREFTLQEKLKDLLNEEDLTLAQFMTSGDPRVKEIHDQDDIFENVQMRFDAFDEEAVGSDKWFSVGNLNAAFEPSRFKQDPTERWLWEKHLPESEITKIISSDVLSCGLPLREDIRAVSTGLDSLNNDDFEEQGLRLSPAPSKSTQFLLYFLPSPQIHFQRIAPKIHLTHSLFTTDDPHLGSDRPLSDHTTVLSPLSRWYFEASYSRMAPRERVQPRSAV